jgi:Flp pilus assembly protein TadD
LVASADVGYRLYQARRFTEAIAPIQKVLQFNSDFVLAHRFVGEVYEANRMYSQALEHLRKAVELSGGAPIDVAGLGHAMAVSGDRAGALRALRRLDELAKTRYVANYDRVLVWVGLGENDRALDALEQAFQDRCSSLVNLNVDARLDPLRGHARFSDLVHRVGLT